MRSTAPWSEVKVSHSTFPPRAVSRFTSPGMRSTPVSREPTLIAAASKYAEYSR
jgi:hypothetical protein